ncbi:MAG: hypothetical protein MK078_10935 [Crocinitomicaceae bacterium]|nr:hypothetical protein [Crocinitomicaceae bacterium]
MKFLLPILGLILLVFSSCGENRIPQGEIEYTITYPYTNVEGFVSAILPEKLVLTFKDTKIKSMIKRGNIFKTEIVSDEKDKSIEMRMEFGNDNYFCDLTEDEVQKMIASQPDYKINATMKQDSIQGLYGSEYTVKNPVDSIIHDNSWFCDHLAPKKAYWYSSYKDISGVPLIFDIERYGVVMHMEITNFTQREVKEEEFNRPTELAPLSYDEYEAKVQELFDILLDE